MRKDEKKISLLLDELTPLFNLQMFSKNVTIKTHDQKSWAASIEGDFVYKNLNINIYPIFFKQSPDEQRRTILHELCHTLNLPTYYNACSLLEGKLITHQHLEDEMESDNCKVEYIIDLLLSGKGKEYKDAYKKYLYGSHKKKNRKKRR